ncbi:MAG: mechanosensitive ion channel family protein [Anaerolineae bacterium]|nr:mechanosensitive ion channel family protein [Anaerolineae bacterium]
MSIQELFELKLWDVSLMTWLWALGLAAGVWFGLKLLRQVISHHLEHRFAETHTLLDDFVYRISKRTWTYLRLAAGLYLLSLFLKPGSAEVRIFLHVGSLLLIIIQIALWGTDVINLWASQYTRLHVEDPSAATKVNAISMLAKVGLWALLLLMALDNVPGVQINTLLASLGVGSVAVALAVQNILGDLFASLSIVFDKPFEIGDYINVGDYNGTVEYIGLKSTRLRSLTGEQLVFANSDLLASRIRNYKRMNRRRAMFTVGVSPETPYELLVQLPGILQAIITAQPDTSFDRAHFRAYGAFTLDFEVVYYMTTTDYQVFMNTQQAINLEIYRQFNDLGIVLPYPTQTVLVKQAQ